MADSLGNALSDKIEAQLKEGDRNPAILLLTLSLFISPCDVKAVAPLDVEAFLRLPYRVCLAGPGTLSRVLFRSANTSRRARPDVRILTCQAPSGGTDKMCTFRSRSVLDRNRLSLCHRVIDIVTPQMSRQIRHIRNPDQQWGQITITVLIFLVLLRQVV